MQRDGRHNNGRQEQKSKPVEGSSRKEDGERDRREHRKCHLDSRRRDREDDNERRDKHRRRSRSRSPTSWKHPDDHVYHGRRRDYSTESRNIDDKFRSEKRREDKRRGREDEEEKCNSEEERRRRRRRHERKERKRDMEAKRRPKGGAVTEYGKHGIINETDVNSRLTLEFRQWLVEERHINPETISRSAEKKEMASFIEDYNTATMPNEKYYNLEVHESRMAMMRAGKAIVEEGGYDPLADEKAAKASFKAQRRKEESSRSAPMQWQSKEQLEALRKVQMERVEAAKMKQLGLQTSANLGVRMDGTEFDRR